MKALITGASSGIGRDMAIMLSGMGCDLIVVARREDRLLALKDSLKTDVLVICADISTPEACAALYEQVKDKGIDIVVNNAGFGLIGRFSETDPDRELCMIDTNIKAVHVLTKLFLRDFAARDSGYILNVASSAAFTPGPLMATYYATKAYVLRLTEAVHEELRVKKSRVYMGVLCPGPVHTEFGRVANVTFGVRGLQSAYVARYAVKKMFQKKVVIIPGTLMKLSRFLTKVLPDRWLARVVYKIQKRK